MRNELDIKHVVEDLSGDCSCGEGWCGGSGMRSDEQLHAYYTCSREHCRLELNNTRFLLAVEPLPKAFPK
jgi:hypothetical protein